MYGTIARMKIKDGKYEEMRKAMTEITSSRNADGSVGMFVFQMDRDPDELFVVVLSESEEKYRAYSESEDSNAGYEVMMRYLEEPPEWNDGKVIESELHREIS